MLLVCILVDGELGTDGGSKDTFNMYDYVRSVV